MLWSHFREICGGRLAAALVCKLDPDAMLAHLNRQVTGGGGVKQVPPCHAARLSGERGRSGRARLANLPIQVMAGRLKVGEEGDCTLKVWQLGQCDGLKAMVAKRAAGTARGLAVKGERRGGEARSQLGESSPGCGILLEARVQWHGAEVANAAPQDILTACVAPNVPGHKQRATGTSGAVRVKLICLAHLRRPPAYKLSLAKSGWEAVGGGKRSGASACASTSKQYAAMLATAAMLALPPRLPPPRDSCCPPWVWAVCVACAVHPRLRMQ